MSYTLSSEKLVLNLKNLHILCNRIPDTDLKNNIENLINDIEVIKQQHSQKTDHVVNYNDVLEFTTTSLNAIKQYTLSLTNQTSPSNRTDFKTEHLVSTINKWEEDLKIHNRFNR